MKNFSISFHSFADIYKFVSLAMKQPFKVLIGNPGQYINAKSLMAMFILDYRQSLEVLVDCDEASFCKFRQEAIHS